MEEVKRLTPSDWEMLLPGAKHTLGRTELTVVPFGVEALKGVVSYLRSVQDTLVSKGITKENYKEPENLLAITELVLSGAPEILALSSGLHVDDVKRLPPTHAVGLVSKIIAVNIESQEGLVKNLVALAETVGSLTKNGE